MSNNLRTTKIEVNLDWTSAHDRFPSMESYLVLHLNWPGPLPQVGQILRLLGMEPQWAERYDHGTQDALLATWQVESVQWTLYLLNEHDVDLQMPVLYCKPVPETPAPPDPTPEVQW